MSGQVHSPSEFRRGWPTVVAATLGIAFGLPTLLFYTLGLIGPELARHFGWSVAAIHGGLTVMMTSLVLLAPLAGFVATRFDVRSSVAISQAALGVSLTLFALLQGSLLQYYLTWALVAVAGAAATPAVITLPVVTRFQHRRGLALGLALLGTGLFATTMKPLVAHSLATLGWRSTFLLLASLPVCVGIPLTLWGFRDRGNLGGQPGPALTAHDAVTPGDCRDGLSFAESLRNWRFWVLACTFLPCALTLAGILPHIEGIAREWNLPPSAVVAAGSAAGAALMAGRLICGLLIDRLWAPGVGAAVLTLAAAGSWLLAADTGQLGTAILGVVLIGFAGGAEYDLVGYLVARYFGTRSYSSISGCLFAVFTLGGGLGPLLFGRALDATGSYHAALIATSAVLLIAGIPLLCLGRYRNFRPVRVGNPLPATQE